MQAPIQERCAGTLCENDTAPSLIQLQIAENTLPQEGVDHESMCSGVQLIDLYVPLLVYSYTCSTIKSCFVHVSELASYLDLAAQ